MLRRTPLIAVVVVAATITAGAPNSSARGACHGYHYTMHQALRFARAVLPLPGARDERELRRVVHCMKRGDLRAHMRLWQRQHQLHLTHTVYAGRVSVDNGTAVAGSLVPKCIALRRNVRNERFLLRLGSRWTIVEQCDWGPASWTGRVIDIHTPALEAMGVYYEPTDSYGTATLLR